MNSISKSRNLLSYFGLGELSSQGWRVILAFWMIIGMTFFLFGDQNLIAPNLKNIAASFGITDQKEIDWYMGGLIPIFFFILGGCVSISMGYFSQKFSRKNLLLFSVLMGEIPCFLTGFSTSYTEFFIYRVLCGFGLGGVFPVLFSIVGDYFSSKSRVTATAYISLAMGLGVGIGQLVGGILGNSDPINGWRTSFIIMSIPSFVFAFVYWIFCKEPKQGIMEEEFRDINVDELSHKLSLEDIKIILKSKTNLGVFLQGIPGCVPWGVFFVFLVDYYESTYSLGKAEASGLLTFAAIGIFLGTFLGGLIGQKLFNINRTYQPLFAMASIFLGVFPCLYLLHAGPIVHSPIFILVNIFAGMIITFPLSNVRSILIAANSPKNRSAAFALYNLTDDLGKGLGPALSAIILTLIPNRTIALSISILFWIPSALFWLPIVFNFKKDELKVRESLIIDAMRVKANT
ncbi:MAG: MFS transporter [Leptospiraceae bacterium]|nr:MFS transporter [Leptospiraceae bacterium]